MTHFCTLSEMSGRGFVCYLFGLHLRGKSMFSAPVLASNFEVEKGVEDSG